MSPTPAPRAARSRRLPRDGQHRPTPVSGRGSGASPRASSAAHLAAQGRARAAVSASQPPDPCGPGQMISIARRGTPMRSRAPRSLWSQLRRLVQAWESNPRPTVYQTAALPTELTCWRPRPRPRAVHASAIHSAGAPGGTQEPAPLTRLPSRPRYGTARQNRTRPNGTRGRSRTCVLWVQSPTGMPATHGSCIGSGGRNRTCVGFVQSEAGIPATHT